MKLLLLSCLVALLINAIALGYYDDENPCGGEVIHWEANQINPYENTVIVVDPYGN